jgi:hypothetical protein
MNFRKYSLGHLEPGRVVAATLSGVESDVFLVDDVNLRSFESGRAFRYFGGHYRPSPIQSQIAARAAGRLL